MARKSIREIRQQELSAAAIDVLMRHGIRGTTLERVAKVAGVSKGIVLHNFKDKDALFEGVLRKTNAILRDGVIELFRHAATPEERLYAVIVGNFAPSVFHQEICHAWISLCSDVPHNRQSRRIQTVVHARMRSNLMSGLRDLVDAETAEGISMQISTLIDGVWLRASLQEEPMSSKEGIDQLDQALSVFLANVPDGIEKRQNARAKMEGLADIILGSKTFQRRVGVSL